MSAVDWDLLADHLGGALAGTPEGDRVARLVATDPAWAEAAAQLTAAWDAVAADLRTVGPAPPLPEQVGTRLDAALRAETAAAPGGRAAAPAGPPLPRSGDDRPPGHPDAGSGRPGPSRSGPGQSGPGRPRPARRRRRAGWIGALAGLAGVAAFVALGPVELSGTDGSQGDAAAPARPEAQLSDDGAVPDAAGAPAPVTALPVMTASDLDYQPDSHWLGAPALVAPPLAQRSEGSPPEQAFSVADRPDPPLDRLWDDPAACLAAVQVSHVPQPITVTQMDFARFEGEPAVILWLTTGDGGGWVQVVGPDCGKPGAGADERYRQALD